MNLYFINLYFMFLFFSGMYVFLINYWNFLINLLSIEYMMLMLVLNLYFYFSYTNYDLFFIMLFLTFMVSESVMGLTLLISMIRNFGNMFLINFLNNV